MNKETIRTLLEEVRAGRLGVEAALARLRGLPYEDLGFAKVDQHRALRGGAPEAIFCQGKSAEQIVAIAGRLAEHDCNVLARRADRGIAAAVAAAGLPHVYYAEARLLVIRPMATGGLGLIAVVAAGTSDLPVAEEAALVAEALGDRVERVYDCGVAGLHRLLAHYDTLAEANVIVAVAGMEGALPSVIGGRLDRPGSPGPPRVRYAGSLCRTRRPTATAQSCAPRAAVLHIDKRFGAPPHA